jgi:flavin-dependent dehydrogenase
MGVSQNTFRKAEVVVVGGGTSGAIAAIASARNGADTLIVESKGFLGGTATFGFPFLGFFNGQGEQVVAGLAQEVVDRLVNLGASPGHVRGGTWSTPENPMSYEFSLTPYDPEILKYVLLLMAEESGVRFLFHAVLTGAVVENGVLKRIDVYTKSGPIRILGKIFVDGTGDADLASADEGKSDFGKRFLAHPLGSREGTRDRTRAFYSHRRPYRSMG